MKLSRIDIDNYEAFLLDRAEGTLSSDLSAELDAFLELHPGLAADTEGFEALSIATDPVFFDHKKEIKRSEHELVTESLMVAYVERQLNKKDTLFVEKSIRGHEGLQAELAMYQKTILQADLSIKYPSKKQLKRRNKIIWFNPSYARYAAAAVLLLFLGLAFMWKQNPAGLKNNPVANYTPYVKLQPAKLPVNAEKTNAIENQMPVTQHPVNSGTAVAAAKLPAKQEDIKQGASPGKQHGLQQNVPLIVNTSFPEKEPVAANSATMAAQPVDPKEAVASNPATTTIVTLEEDDDDADAATKKKSVLWAMAGKALKGFNKAGLKTVDGAQKDNKTVADYQLTLGGFQVTHSENLD